MVGARRDDARIRPETPMPMPPKEVVSKDGRRFRLRPIRPSDAASLMKGYDMLSDRAKWFRLLHAVPHLTEEMAREFCSPDPEKDVCLVIEADDGSGDVIGGARLMGDGPGRAEFAVSMRPDAQGLGLARQALEAVLEVGRSRGVREVWGRIAAANEPMLGLARRIGFDLRHDPDEPAMMLAELRLSDAGAAQAPGPAPAR